MEVPISQFRQWKKQRVEDHIDCSKKGAIDEDIVGLVKIVNDSIDYFTTSSCSGRLVCYVEASSLRVHGPWGRLITCTTYTDLLMYATCASAYTGVVITLVLIWCSVCSLGSNLRL